MGMFGSVFLLVQYLQVVQGYSPLEAGVRTLPWTAAPMLVAPVAGLPHHGSASGRCCAARAHPAGRRARLDRPGRHARRRVRRAGPGVRAGRDRHGAGRWRTAASTAVLADMADNDHAAASSTNATIREIGVALGVAVLVAVFEGAGGTITPDGYTDALRPAILTGAAVVAVGAIAARWLPPARPAEGERVERARRGAARGGRSRSADRWSAPRAKGWLQSSHPFVQRGLVGLVVLVRLLVRVGVAGEHLAAGPRRDLGVVLGGLPRAGRRCAPRSRASRGPR